MLATILRFIKSLQHRERHTILASSSTHGEQNEIENSIPLERQEGLSKNHLLSGPIKETTTSPEGQHLLEQTRLQWQRGEWTRLATLELQSIEEYPERSVLALLSASAKMQLGDVESAHRFLKQAENWGCRKALIAEFLVAGVHNNLARASILTGRTKSAQMHLNCAASTRFLKNEIAFFNEEREQEQRRQLGFPLSHLETGTGINAGLDERSQSELSKIDFSDCANLATTMSKTDPARLNNREVIFDDRAGAIPFPFFYRPDSKGDIGVLQQIFEEKQYECGWLPQGKELLELARKIKTQGGTPAIVDGGANIGASAAWFAKRYPGSVVLAVEPDRDNCELLRNNCAGLPVRVFEGGLADSRKKLFIEDPGQSDWGYRLTGEGNVPVQCVGVTDILSYCDKNSLTPLILKLDIEGGEDAVFSGDTSWIKNFPVIIIELHDWLFPDKNTSRNFLRAAASAGLQVFTRGENLFCFNRECLKFYTIN